MKKLLIACLSVLAVAGLFWSNQPSAAAAIGVNNFQIQDYQIDYYLGTTADKRSTLKTVEVISAVFPQIDQNHGIERALPNTYNGHTTGLEISSVTDSSNKKLAFNTRESNGNTVLRIGDADSYVHGLQIYKITYTQRDVTNFFGDTSADEFYWDTNGTEWAVPIQALSVRLHLTDGVAADLTGEQQCYRGGTGATGTCTIQKTGNSLNASVTGLNAYENMTLAVGFKPGTFTPYQPTLSERLLGIWIILFVITTLVSIALVIWLTTRFYRRSERTAEIGPVPPEYLPPKDTSVAVAATIAKKSRNMFSAQLIDFAVRHYIKLYQTREKSFFRQANYEIEIIKDIADLKAEEKELLQDIFGDPHIGARLDMETLKRNTKVSTKLMDNPGKLTKAITGQYALRAPVEEEKAWFMHTGKTILLIALLTLSPGLLTAAIVAFVCGYTLKPLTDKGLALARYMKGLELYITMAETDRLQALQSPEGAAKLPAPVDTNDKRQVVKLYERVLPYAILLGQEKEWNKRLGQYYETLNESPGWIVSSNHAVFNAAIFSSAVSGLNTVASYSDPSSSSSGGSSGGGSSGGGGGGGGGGGW